MKAKALQSDELVDGEPIKEKLHLRDRAFRDLHHKGLPHYKINSRVFRYRWSEIERWLASRRAGEAA